MRKNFPQLLIIACLAAGLSACNNLYTAANITHRSDIYKIYRVHRLSQPIAINADWNKPAWQKVKPLDIKLFMGKKPRHLPKTQAKLLYDDKYIYVIFRVEDRYVRAVTTQYQGKVWQDSCVEFFFTPGTDIRKGYFNLETNCGGTILCRHQVPPTGQPVYLTLADCKHIKIAHSLPKIVEPEIKTPVTWTLEYRLPLEVLQKYAPVTKPAPGVKWRANFYKCADKTSHPHWLTWSFVNKKSPAFHVPEYFGTLQFLN